MAAARAVPAGTASTRSGVSWTRPSTVARESGAVMVMTVMSSDEEERKMSQNMSGILGYLGLDGTGTGTDRFFSG